MRNLTLALALIAVALPAAETGANAPDIPVDQIIDNFVAKETEFARAREAYTYRQTVKIIEYNEANRPGGRWELVQDIIFGPNKERTERVGYAPVSTLRRITLTPQDMQDLRDVQPFVMTQANRHEYNVASLGPQRVDEIDTYLFSVKPIKMEKGNRYFEGQVWVDQLDLQIVKTFGKGVGIVKKHSANQFPAFETYRDQIDGEYWFPIYTAADDVLHFRNGDIRIKMVIKYEDYKRFGTETGISFGDIIDDTGGETAPAQPDQNPQAAPAPEAEPTPAPRSPPDPTKPLRKRPTGRP